MKRALGALAALLAGLVLSAALAELVLSRSTGLIDTPPGLFRPSATRAFEHRPGFRGRDIRGHAIRLNSLGMRDRETPAVKPPGVRRVLVLGDSVAFGDQVAVGDAFPDRLEARLGPGVEVLNAGVRGYNTVQQLALLREIGWRTDPDVVLVAYVLNDAEPLRAQAGLLDRHRHGWLVRLKDLVKSRSYTYAFLRRNLELARHRVTPEQFVETYDDQFSPDSEGWKASAEALRGIADECRARGAVPALALFPRLEGLGREEAYPHAALHARVLEAARAAGFETVDLLEAWRGRDAASLRVTEGDLFHPTPEGHALVAVRLERFLRPLLERRA